MTDQKEVRVTKSFINKQIKKGSLFLREKYLDSLPLDWMECVMFVSTQGTKNESDISYVLVMDDEQTKKVFDLIAKEQITILILNEDKEKLWNVLLTKEKNKETNEYERFFMGGENLRNFCDERNIYYRSGLSSNGELLSGTNMLYQKNPGEDCRIPTESI